MSRTRRIADIINVLMVSMCIAAPLSVVEKLMTDSLGNYPLLLLGIFLVLLCSHFLRVKVGKAIWFALGHLLVIAVTVLIGLMAYNGQIKMDVSIPIVWFIMSIVIFVVDIAFWIGAIDDERNLPVQENGSPVEGFKPVFKEGLPYISVYFVIMFVLMMFITIYRGFDRLRTDIYVSGIVYMVLFFVRMYLRNISKLVATAELGNNVTQKRLLKANTMIVVPFIALMVVAMTLFQAEVTAEMIRKFLGMIANGLAYIIVFLIMLFSGGEVERTYEPLVQNRPMELGYGDNPAWLDMIYRILEYLLYIALTGLIIYLLVKLVVKIVKFYNTRSTNKLRQRQFGDMTEVSEHIVSTKSKAHRSRRKLYSRMSNREKIRYLYRKFVLKTSRAGYDIRKNHTPDERCKDMVEYLIDGNKKATKAVNLTSEYDKARYSDDEITDEDVKCCT